MPDTDTARRRRPWLALLLSLLCPGLGQIYNTQVRRGLVALALGAAFWWVLPGLPQVSVAPTSWTVVVLVHVIALLGWAVWLAIAVDAFIGARRRRMATLGPWNRLWVYLSILVGLLTAAVIWSLFLQDSRSWEAFSIPSRSNQPTLISGDYLISWRGYYRDHEPRRGDMAVFKLPADPGIDYVKRLVGLPGDRVQIRGGVLYLNGDAVPREHVATRAVSQPFGGTAQIEEYRETLPNGLGYLVWEHGDRESSDDTPEYVVPPGHVFFLGDNRDRSQDSRDMGPVGFVPIENLRAYPTFIFWSGDRGRIGTRVQPTR